MKESKGAKQAGELSPGPSLQTLVSVRQVSAAINVSAATVRRMIKNGSLRKITLNGKTVRIPLSDVRNLIGGAA